MIAFSGNSCFRVFLDALKDNGYETLANTIESTDVSADPAVKPRGTPSQIYILINPASIVSQLDWL